MVRLQSTVARDVPADRMASRDERSKIRMSVCRFYMRRRSQRWSKKICDCGGLRHVFGPNTCI